MGNLPNDSVCSKMMGYLLSWHLERNGWEAAGAHGVRGGLPGGSELLRVDCDGGVWRVEVRLPGGSRAAASRSGSLQEALAKARAAACG